MRTLTVTEQPDHFSSISQPLENDWDWIWKNDWATSFDISIAGPIEFEHLEFGWDSPAVSAKSVTAILEEAPTRNNVFHIDHARRAKRLFDQLDRFAARKPDWDGDDGIAPSRETLAEARAFLSFLRLTGCVPHTTYAPGDGEINFEWRAARRFTEVGFSGDGTVSWFHRDADGEICRDEPFDLLDIRQNADLLKVLGVEDEGN